ncbi:Ran-specific GTPase-activating protein 30 [Pseudocercospora fuligena]|uniref:Ran-specific GTPase-activating protein 30 n=1 Tax=Pseudocercospora fuligena TaxID=685502 RepID=A0A8H6RVL8_9PEZI|nr:Ran-specific GTPase-activating protein 30 [Pseudocercospora fuligena]
MDILLSRVTQQAVHYAIRSGISITTGYALKECGRLLKQAPKGRDREELQQLQFRLESKIRVISPSIDMIELIAARGNTSLESAVSLCKDIRYEIQKLGQRLQKAATHEELAQRKAIKSKSREETDDELKGIINQMKLLLARIEDAVPLINLAITTSGVNLSTKLSGTISPSRLLQASTFLSSADAQFGGNPTSRQQVGPTYVLTMYMLFAGHAARPVDERGVRETTWKEVIHKARVKLWRVPLDQLYTRPGEAPETDCYNDNTIPADAKASEFAYQLAIVEDLDDDRVHTFEDDEPQPGTCDDVANAGIRDVVPIHEISKIFYADTGKILNIGGDGETNNPVLLLKRDVHAEPPRRMLQRSQSRAQTPDYDRDARTTDHQSEIDAQLERESSAGTPQKPTAPSQSEMWRLPADLDPEWMAFEVYVEDEDSDTEDELPADSRSHSRSTSLDPGVADALARLNLTSSPAGTPPLNANSAALALSPNKRTGPPIKTTLSLLEMLLKLSALQQFRQESHLAIEDELLNFFLEDSATAGAGADKSYRQRLRHDAMKRVGFDPYDESPIKRRSEEYIRDNGGSPRSVRESLSPEGFSHEIAYDEAYEYEQQPIPKLDFVRSTTERFSPKLAGTKPSYSPRQSQQPVYQQTPSRTSTPDLTSDAHRQAVSAKYAGGGRPSPSPQSRPLATPPSSGTGKTRMAALRSQSDNRPRSPLHEAYTNDEQ